MKFEKLKSNYSKTHERTANKKNLDDMDKVHETLIEFKRKMNCELFILNDDKILGVKS